MFTKNRLRPIFLALSALFVMACSCPFFAPSPSDYVPVKSGDCFVPPQGDPVYDQFYSENVNPNNCEAFKDQAQGHEYDANAKKIMAEELQIRSTTNMNNIGAFFTVVIVLVLAVVLSVLYFRGA